MNESPILHMSFGLIFMHTSNKNIRGGFMSGQFIVPISRMPSVSTLKEAENKSSRVQSDVQIPFSDVFRDVYENLAEQQEISDRDALDLSLGNSDDLHNIMINSEAAAIALELTVQITSKALNAYNEIMRMQI